MFINKLLGIFWFVLTGSFGFAKIWLCNSSIHSRCHRTNQENLK
jgi:hypothetical protein